VNCIKVSNLNWGSSQSGMMEKKYMIKKYIYNINLWDIHNVQMLARRLILGKLGLWRFDQEGLKNT